MDTWLDAVKTTFKKVVHKAGVYFGKKIADAVTKSNNDTVLKPDENPRNVEEIIIALRKRDKILNKSWKVLQK